MAAARKYSGWSLDKLRSEKERIEKAIKVREGGRHSAIQAIRDAVRKSGFELSELIDDLKGGGGKKRGRPAGKKKAASKKKARSKLRGKKVAPKYRNPKEPDQTWTGRGRAPVWVREHEDKHGNRKGLEIK